MAVFNFSDLVGKVRNFATETQKNKMYVDRFNEFMCTSFDTDAGIVSLSLEQCRIGPNFSVPNPIGSADGLVRGSKICAPDSWRVFSIRTIGTARRNQWRVRICPYDLSSKQSQRGTERNGR